jgi:hypothetical protein
MHSPGFWREGSVGKTMSERERGSAAAELMRSFAQRTGLDSARPQVRYLWTDAFAVCNLLALGRITENESYPELALRLVDRVHETLGRHRGDDGRTGWLSGLSDSENLLHPTRGGLRIGKPLPERGPSEPFDEDLEWERDGQYFHYLTKWMHALDQVSRFTREPRFNLWARELAETAFAAFAERRTGSQRRRMAWKMAIDLSRPLVARMGQHDPLDGYITCAQLRSTSAELGSSISGPDLEDELAGFRAMLDPETWVTSDPLGLGGLLVDAGRVSQLLRRGFPEPDLLPSLLVTAWSGLRSYLALGEPEGPAERRLAFRELGLAIGLEALGTIRSNARWVPGAPSRVQALLDRLDGCAALPGTLRAFWLSPVHRAARSWMAHQDINEVMLATSLVADGFLLLPPLDGAGTRFAMSRRMS